MSTDCISSQDIGFSEPLGPVVGQVSPSEQLITLTLGQLQDLIQEAIERATAPLVERLQDLQARIDRLDDVVDDVTREVGGVGPGEGGEDLQAVQDQERSQPAGRGMKISTFQIVHSLQAENHALKRELEALQDLRPWLEALSKKLARLEAPKTSRKTEARAEKIERYLKERPDHKATYETLRGHLGVEKARLNEAIKLLMTKAPGRYGIARLPGDKRGRALIMLPK